MQAWEEKVYDRMEAKAEGLQAEILVVKNNAVEILISGKPCINRKSKTGTEQKTKEH